MKYKHIVFDVDGTLVDTEAACLLSFRDLLKEQKGEDHEPEELTYCLGRSGKDSLAQAGFEDWRTAYDRWVELLLNYSYTIKIFDGLLEVIEKLAEAGYQLGIVTSRTRAVSVMDLKTQGVDAYFKTIVSCDDTEKHKPNPEPLLKYLEYTGADASEVLYLGDTVHDMNCAGGANIDFALAGWGAPVMLDAKYVLNQPKELLDLLEK